MSRQNPIWGIDVSHWQGTVNWGSVASEDFTFMLAKASEGTYYEDDQFERNLRVAAERGIVPGAYLFLTNEDVYEQVDKFLDVIGSAEGKLIALDCEDPRWYGEEGRGQPSVTDVWNATHYLYDKIGPHPILIYSGAWWWRRMGSPDIGSLARDKGASLWVSRYVNGSDYASILYQSVPAKWWNGEDGGGFGGAAPTILQFTDRAAVAGQEMDANAYSGTMADLRALTTSKGKGKSSPEEHEYLIEVMGESGGGGYTIYFTEKPTPINLESNDAIEQRGSGWRWSGGVARGGRDSVRCGDLPNIVSADHNLKITVDGATKKAPDNGGGGKRELSSPTPDYSRWSPKTAELARLIHESFDVEVDTYEGHGDTGEAYAMDVWVAPEGGRHTQAQFDLGVQIDQFILDRWQEYDCFYLIFSGGITNGGPWRTYDPGTYQRGSNDPQTRAHQDHVHLSRYQVG